MNILFLTDNFPPEVNAPASRTFEHAREWVKQGHAVTVLTCAPNVPRGEVYEGYANKWRQVEDMDGIRVVRVKTYITANEGFARRSLDYLSFMVSATFFGLFEKRPDVVVATSPQFLCALGGWLLSAFKWRPFVFELRDLWPESINAVGALEDGLLLRALERLEMFLYRRAAAIVSVTHTFREHLMDRGIDGGKIHVVTNGVALDQYEPMDKDQALVLQHQLADKFVAGYIGTHGMAHALETLLEAADLLRDRKDIALLMLGDGAAKHALVQTALAKGMANVVFVDSVNKADVPRYWSLLDATIIHLKKTPLFRSVIPSKMFETMAMGIPIVHVVQGESAVMIEESGAGVLVEPENADALAEVLLSLAEASDRRADLSRGGIAAAQQYDRTKLAADMVSVLEQVAGSNVRKDA